MNKAECDLCFEDKLFGRSEPLSFVCYGCLFDKYLSGVVSGIQEYFGGSLK